MSAIKTQINVFFTNLNLNNIVLMTNKLIQQEQKFSDSLQDAKKEK